MRVQAPEHTAKIAEANRKRWAEKRQMGCTMPDCSRPYYAKGMCVRHYQRTAGRLDPKTKKRRHDYWANPQTKERLAAYKARPDVRERSQKYQREQFLKRRWNLTPEQVVAMGAAQDDCCAICRRPLAEVRPHIDHDEATGKIRGILCGPCNQGIGLLRHEPTILVSAIAYLGRHRSMT